MRRDLRSSCFSWRPLGEPICRALGGVWQGEAPSRPPDRPGRGGCLVGISPQTPRNGLPPHQALGQPDPSVRLDGAGWTRQALSPRGLRFCFPGMMVHSQGPCSLRSKWSIIGARGLWSDDRVPLFWAISQKLLTFLTFITSRTKQDLGLSQGLRRRGAQGLRARKRPALQDPP